MFKLNLVPGKLTLQDIRRVKNEQTVLEKSISSLLHKSIHHEK